MKNIKKVTAELGKLVTATSQTHSALKRVSSTYNDFRTAISEFSSVWSSDPDMRNRPGRQNLTTELNKLVSSTQLMHVGELLSNIEDELDG